MKASTIFMLLIVIDGFLMFGINVQGSLGGYNITDETTINGSRPIMMFTNGTSGLNDTNGTGEYTGEASQSLMDKVFGGMLEFFSSIPGGNILVTGQATASDALKGAGEFFESLIEFATMPYTIADLFEADGWPVFIPLMIKGIYTAMIAFALWQAMSGRAF